MKKRKEIKDWFLGLDIGTNSVGYAVTDMNYNLIKFKNNAMWGIHLFEKAEPSTERRAHRTNRRTLERKKQRIMLLKELMASEIAKVDKNFFLRLDESNLIEDDRSLQNKSTIFDDLNYKDADYFKEYPTIHHLIKELMENNKKYDIRLIYLACAFLIKHRGHFLLSIDKKNINDFTNFELLYNNLENWFSHMDLENPFNCEINKISDILKSKKSKNDKKKEFEKILSSKKLLKDDLVLNMESFASIITGGDIEVSKLFGKENYNEIKKIKFSNEDIDKDIENLKGHLEDYEIELIYILKNIYDWSLLMNFLEDEKTGELTSISAKKVQIYEEYKKDLKHLKKIIKKYGKENSYKEVFKNKSEKKNQDKFNNINKNLENISVDAEDKDIFERIQKRIEKNILFQKQVSTDNRIIPYQLYWNELKKILDNASNHYDFLNEKDEYGTVKDKILSIMEFKIPYYVGPLNKNSKFAWIERKEGKIYPWNFDEMVDKDASENEFINRMIGRCTYLPYEKVIPKNSLLYSKFNVLNEINNIKINEQPISVEIKQKIYEKLFLMNKRVSLKSIKELLKTEGVFQDKDKISGIDSTIKSSLKSYLDFKEILQKNILSEKEVEEIIERITCTNDKKRLEKYLREKYKENDALSDDYISYISNLEYSEFGRLSRKLLEDIFELDKNTGELKEKNIITMMWETNENLMQLLSGKYGYLYRIEQEQKEGCIENKKDICQRMEDMYISNSVKRPILRTMDIVKELRYIMKTPPKKIFVETLRDNETEVKKGKKSTSRKKQIEDLYKKIDNEDKDELIKILNLYGEQADSKLRSKKLFLYFMQLGKCMYTNQPIQLSEIFTNRYDIEHIYPRSKVKDDSLDNLVLVFSKVNSDKSNNYPISKDIQSKMSEFWKYLHKNKLISDIKYNRLIRDYPFNDDELAGFIARQLVETKQSTKAVATFLKEMFPQSEIVYVKAGLVSEFRQEYKFVKCREINDFHHAKDAYLNIVVGNAYNVKFTKNPTNFIKINHREKGEKYTLKLKNLLKHNIIRNNETAWIREEEENATLNTVKKIMLKNNLRFVRYSSCQKGKLFDVTILPKKSGQLPVKNPVNKNNTKFEKMSNIDNYGGYGSLKSTYFYLVKHQKKNEQIIEVVPVDLVYELRMKTKDDIINYLTDVCKMQNPQILLNGRKIKYNTLFEIDGYRCHLSCKSCGKSSNYILFKNAQQFVVSNDMERYIKRLVKYNERNQQNSKKTKEQAEMLKITKEDEITKEKNEELYNLFIDKLENTKYCIVFELPLKVIKNGKEQFNLLSVEEQSIVLCKLLKLFQCDTSSGKDLSDIGGARKSGIIKINTKLKSKSVYIIDQSSTGLFEKKSPNLLNL